MAVCQQPRKGSEVLLRRDIDEIFINNYNSEWIVNWDANIDVSPVYDYYGTITYITDYFTKDSTGLTEVLKTAVKQLGDDMDMREKCHRMADLFMTHRQVGEAEVFYKLFAHMNLVYSSVATIFVPTEPKGQRRQFLQRQDPESGLGFRVEDKEGFFMEKPDLISKYERRKLVNQDEDDNDDQCDISIEKATLEAMCFCQFVKMYQAYQERRTNEEGCTEAPRDIDTPEEGELEEIDNFNFLVSGKFHGERRPIPDMLTLDEPVPGEPTALHKRNFPRALRFFKKKFEADSHRYYLSELMLYHPFRNENDLFPEDPVKCEELYRKNIDEIRLVKAELMPFLESVEEAQLIYEETKAQEEQDVQEKMGADLDPTNEQEIADIDDEDEEEHPDYYHIDTDLAEESPRGEVGAKRVFKTIKLPSKHEQVMEARNLDRRQKEVLAIGLNYAKRLVISSKKRPSFPHSSQTTFTDLPQPTFPDSTHINSALPSPPLVIVHGGAGSGKSRVINSLYAMMSNILQQAGDDPNLPYVVLTSFTGAASANINGQTLHSLFGFKFGTTFLSLSERQRAEKRALFKNLRCIIIDEISMVSADLFYNLDLRLREIKPEKGDRPFGGVSVFVFGDLYQLQPPKARYVFQEPNNKEHALSHSLRNLWRLFSVINLEENHRQGEDKVYGDLLNRVRTGDQTEDDVALLQTRVRPKDDPCLNDSLHIYGTNAKVNARNDAKLKEIPGELFTIKARTASRTVKSFRTNNAGCVQNTPFQATLNLKINAEVTLVHNIDTLDGLTNGARGILVDVERKGKNIQRLLIKFHNPDHGRMSREKNPSRKHPDATYIDMVHWKYYIGGATATISQFPVKAAEATSAHKIQGQTVGKPKCLVVDVTSSHQPGMVYVMLSRVCSLEQLYIIEKFDEDKISVNEYVKAEARRMLRKSLNKNPCNWMNPKAAGLKVCSLNVRSLSCHIEDVKSDPVLLESHVLCLQETWMTPEEQDSLVYQLENFRGNFTCVGRGKGIAVYVRQELCESEAYRYQELCKEHLQVGKISLNDVDIINVYRSQEEPFYTMAHYLGEMIDLNKTSLIVGDFNYDAANETNEVSKYLSKQQFKQLVTSPTHLGGHILDQAHLRQSLRKKNAEVKTFTPYYSDHDIITVILR